MTIIAIFKGFVPFCCGGAAYTLVKNRLRDVRESVRLELYGTAATEVVMLGCELVPLVAAEMWSIQS